MHPTKQDKESCRSGCGRGQQHAIAGLQALGLPMTWHRNAAFQHGKLGTLGAAEPRVAYLPFLATASSEWITSQLSSTTRWKSLAKAWFPGLGAPNVYSWTCAPATHYGHKHHPQAPKHACIQYFPFTATFPLLATAATTDGTLVLHPAGQASPLYC